VYAQKPGKEFFQPGIVSTLKGEKYLIALEIGGGYEVTLANMRKAVLKPGDRVVTLLEKATVSNVNGLIVTVSQQGSPANFKVAMNEIAKWTDRVMQADDIVCGSK
jgi:hypothetical protein